MFPARFIFGVLCIIQVQRVDFTNQEGFNTAVLFRPLLWLLPTVVPGY